MIEIVEEDVRQKRTQRPACGTPARVRITPPVGQLHSGSQVSPDQGQDSLVSDLPSQAVHQHVVADGIKERLQIAIDDPFRSLLLRFPLHRLDRIGYGVPDEIRSCGR
ncbi:MAG: hypothetical protein R3F31_25280 [Verrucomicrobiales bacterium]